MTADEIKTEMLYRRSERLGILAQGGEPTNLEIRLAHDDAENWRLDWERQETFERIHSRTSEPRYVRPKQTALLPPTRQPYAD